MQAKSLTYPEYAVDAYIQATRGVRHDRFSLAEAYAEQVADALMAAVNGKPRAWGHTTAHGPERHVLSLRPTVDGVLMPDDMIGRPQIDQRAYAAEVKRGNSEFIRAYFALEDRARELGVELDS